MSRFRFKPIQIILLVICAVVFIVSMSMLISRLVSEKNSEKQHYTEINSNVESILNGSDTESATAAWNREQGTSTDFWGNVPDVSTATQTETETETETEIVTETESEKEVETETETEKASETEINTESETATRTETEIISDSETASETESVRETETEKPTETATETATKTETETEAETEYHSEKFLAMKAQIEKLQETNPEVWGYLYVEIHRPNQSSSDVISYPLMLTDNNEYYLTHAWDNTYSKTGAIFADFRTFSDYETNRNIVIYGHNMAAGTMLHDLTKIYTSKSTFYGTGDAYVKIQIYTTKAIYNYDIFSIYTTEADSDYRTVYFTSADGWTSFLEERQDLSKWSKDYDFYPSDRIITFSTCTNLVTDGRMAIHAILTSIEY